MNMESNYPVDPKNLSDKGTKGVMSSAAGLGMLGVNALLGVPVVGTVISAGLLALGATGLLGKTKTDKTSGTVLTVAGVAGLTTCFAGPCPFDFVAGRDRIVGVWGIQSF